MCTIVSLIIKKIMQNFFDRFTRSPEVYPIVYRTNCCLHSPTWMDHTFWYSWPNNHRPGASIRVPSLPKTISLLCVLKLRTMPSHPSFEWNDQTNASPAQSYTRTFHIALDSGSSFVLLGFRSVVKEEIRATAAEMTYGTILRLSADFFQDLKAEFYEVSTLHSKYCFLVGISLLKTNASYSW